MTKHQTYSTIAIHSSNGSTNGSPLCTKSAPITSESTDQLEAGSREGSEELKLRKELSLFNGITIILGYIIGSGIFVTPTGVLDQVKAVVPALIVWVLGGMIATVGALCYAELGSAIPQSGGDYAYIREAFGGLPSFMFLWVALFIIFPVGSAVAALTLAEYALTPIYEGCQPSTLAIKSFAALSIMFLTFVNCYNVKWVTFVSDTFTTTKVVALILIIGAGAYHSIVNYLLMEEQTTTNPHLEDIKNAWTNPWAGMSTSPASICLAFYSGLFSYSGYNCLNFVTEELKNPYKNLPRAIFISLPTVTTIYVLVNVAYFAVLSPTQVRSSPAVAITFGNEVLSPYISWMMPVSVAMSTFGALNGGIFASSRLLFVGARAGHLPTVFSMINVKYMTPIPALIFVGLVTLSYLLAGSIFTLINYYAFIEACGILTSVAALLYFRWKKPDMYRPIKISLIYPIFFFVVCLFLVILPVIIDYEQTFVAVLITLSGIPVYFIFVYWDSRPKVINDLIEGTTRLFQKFFICLEGNDRNKSILNNSKVCVPTTNDQGTQTNTYKKG